MDKNAGIDSAYSVDEVLKRSDAEVTEVVYFQGADGGELGPFVRKRIARESGLGSAYDALYRAQQEGKRFKHLPRMVDIHPQGDEIHVVMEYVHGETLAELVDCTGASPQFALRVMPVVCDAVAELHTGVGTPLIHRDLKPSNIMVAGADGGEGAQVTLIDLGIARAWRDGAQADTAHWGTRCYAPPEQFGFGQTDVRSDVYALGKLILFCCMGEEPAVKPDMAALRDAGVSDALIEIILRATAFDPERRYESAAALRKALREVSVEEDGGQSSRAGVSTVLGIAWNVALACILALFFMGSAAAVADPIPENAHLPSWFLALELALVVDIPICLLAFALCDRRRRLRAVPVLARMGRLKVAGLAVAVAVVALVVLTALGNALGWVV